MTLSHLFIECKLVCNFWKRFKIWWKENTNERVHLLAVKILYGILELSKNKQLINQLLLIAKYHIFSSYIREERCNFGRFLLEVHRRYQIGQQIAPKSQCTETFNRKMEFDLQSLNTASSVRLAINSPVTLLKNTSNFSYCQV